VLCADSLSLREFLRLAEREIAPDRQTRITSVVINE